MQVLLIMGVVVFVGMILVPSTARSVPVGSGHYHFTDFPGQNWIVPVWTYRPQHAGANAPIVIVCHGLDRNGETYRNAWISSADRLGFILIVPEFTTISFPGSRSYNQGNLFSSNGNPNPIEQWSFQVIERVFDDVVARLSGSQTGYHLYGHSAGAQFVHRMLLLMPDIRVERAVSANAGWYTLADPEVDYPYGLRNSPYETSIVNERLTQNHLVLLGTEDNNPNDSSLNRSPETDVQGIHRFERGHYFFNTLWQYAESQMLEPGWSLGYAPGVAHSNSGMAPFAANWLLHPWQGVGLTLYQNPGSFYTQAFSRGLPANTNNEAEWLDNATFPGFFAYYQNQGTPEQYRVGSVSVSGTHQHWRTNEQSGTGFIGGRPDEQTGDMHFGIRLTNHSGLILDRLSIGYVGTQYYNSQSTQAGRITVAHRADAPASLHWGEWVEIAELTFSGPYTGDDTGEPVETNPYSILSRETFSPVGIDGVRWFPGQSHWIRWTIVHQPGFNHGLGIDNIVIRAELAEVFVPESLLPPVVTIDNGDPHWTVFLPLHALGLNYQLEQSANFTDWQPVVSPPPVENASGLYWKIDPFTDSTFLRVVASPP